MVTRTERGKQKIVKVIEAQALHSNIVLKQTSRILRATSQPSNSCLNLAFDSAESLDRTLMRPSVDSSVTLKAQ